MELIRHFPGRGLAFARSLLVFLLLSQGAALAQMPYFTDFKAALANAQTNGKLVILYTGRAELCPGHVPKTFFFDSILKRHLSLGTRTNSYVVCERFMFAPVQDANGNFTPGFYAEMNRDDALYNRYDIKLSWPTIVILDANGVRLSGPYPYSYLDDSFRASEPDSYLFLDEYGADGPPILPSQARTNLMTMLLKTDSKTNLAGFHVFPATYDKTFSQDEIIMDSGLPTRAYQLGKAIPFAVGDFTATFYQLPKGDQTVTEITVAGDLPPRQGFTGPILVQVNGVNWESELDATNNYVAYDKLAYHPGQYCFVLEVHYKPAADVVAGALKEVRQKRKQ